MKLSSLFSKPKRKTTYQCSCCGQLYDELPLCFGSEYPDYYFSVPPGQRAERIELKESLCVVDNEKFFHRGRLTIPIIDHNNDLVFNVWTSISQKKFTRRMDLWEDQDRTSQAPYFGWLQTTVKNYGDTLNIKTVAVEQEICLIPEIRSIEEGHKLTIDQENGIDYKRAVAIVDEILKDQHQKH